MFELQPAANRNADAHERAASPRMGRTGSSKMKKMITLLAVLGMVLALAPAAQAAPGDRISGVTATASSEGASRPAINAVNGTGMVSGELATGMHNQQ